MPLKCRPFPVRPEYLPETSLSARNCLASGRGFGAISIPFRTSLPLFRFSLPLFHSHHHPRRWVLPIQLRRFHNQLLHSRPFHVGHAPQPYVSHEPRLALQQFLGIGKGRSPEKCKCHMFFPQYEATQRPIRIKRWHLPWAYILLAARRRFLHQRSHGPRETRQLSRLLHVRIDPQPPLFPFNRWHLALLRPAATQESFLKLILNSQRMNKRGQRDPA